MPIKVAVEQTGLERSIQNGAKKAGRNLKINLGSSAKSIDALSQPLGRITGKADEFGKSMEAANARVLAFGASVGILNTVIQSFKELVTTTIEVEKNLTKINSILNTNAAGLSKLSSDIFNIARATEQTFDTVSEAALELSRQGLSATEVTKRLNDSLILARLSGVSAADAVSNLTSAVNGFSKSGLTTSEILNKVSAAANKFAVSERDLFEGFKRSASVAQQAGVSLDELGGLITALQQKTARGGAVIGNSLKTIFTRIGKAESLDVLRDIGVEITDLSGNILPATKLLENYAKRFKDISPELQRFSSFKIGGGFQIAPLLAALDDYGDKNSIAIQATEKFANATDEAYKKNAILSQTLSASINSLVLDMKELANVLGEIGVTDTLRNVLDFFSNLATNIREILQGDTIGGTFARGIVKGISDVLTGPGLAIFALIVGKLAKDLLVFGTKSVSTFLVGFTKVNQKAQETKNIQDQIVQTLLNDKSVRDEVLKIQKRSRNEEEAKLNTVKYFNTALQEQLGLYAQIKSIGVGAAPGVLDFSRRVSGGPKVTSTAKTSAGGFLPIGAENSDIARGVGGAPKSAKSVVIPNFSFGGGKKGTMVANSSEYIVPNYAGGGSAIFNQDMVRSMGLPSGAKKINASGGYVPNFAHTLGVNKDSIAIRSVTSPLDAKFNRKRGTGAVKNAIKDAVLKAKNKNFSKITADIISDSSLGAFRKYFGVAKKGKNTWDVSQFNNAAKGFIPNFARGIYDSDYLAGTAKKQVLDSVLAAKGRKDVLVGPAGSGKTTLAKKGGGSIIKSQRQVSKFNEFLILSAAAKAKNSTFSAPFQRILEASKASGGNIQYAYVPNDELDKRRLNRAETGSDDLRDQKGLARTSYAPKNQQAFMRGLGRQGASFTRNYAKGYIPNFAAVPPAFTQFLRSEIPEAFTASGTYSSTGASKKLGILSSEAQLRKVYASSALRTKFDSLSSDDRFSINKQTNQRLSTNRKAKQQGKYGVIYPDAIGNANPIDISVGKSNGVEYSAKAIPVKTQVPNKIFKDLRGKIIDSATEFVSQIGFQKKFFSDNDFRKRVSSSLNVGSVDAAFGTAFDAGFQGAIGNKTKNNARWDLQDQGTISSLYQKLSGDSPLQQSKAASSGLKAADFKNSLTDDNIESILGKIVKSETPKSLPDAKGSKNAAEGYIPNFVQTVGEPIPSATSSVGQLIKSKSSVDRFKGQINAKYGKNGKQVVHNTDTITSPKIEVINLKGGRTTELLRKKAEGYQKAKKAEQDFEQYVANLQKGAVSLTSDVKTGAANVNSAALDAIGGNLLEEVKAGGYSKRDIQEKFMRFPLENYIRQEGKVKRYFTQGFSFGANDNLQFQKKYETKLYAPDKQQLDKINKESRKKYFGKTKNAASGYIPNFAMSPIQDAIKREKDAGVPVNQIRINQSGKLRNAGNPQGLAVTNTRDEPTGRIPNYAAEPLAPLGGGYKGYNRRAEAAEKKHIASLRKSTQAINENTGTTNKQNQEVNDSSGKLFALSSGAFALQGVFGSMGQEAEGASKAMLEFSQGVSQAVTTMLLFQGLGGGIGAGKGFLTGFGEKSGKLTGLAANATTRAGKILQGSKGIAVGAFKGLGSGIAKVIPYLGQAVIAFQLLNPLLKTLGVDLGKYLKLFASAFESDSAKLSKSVSGLSESFSKLNDKLLKDLLSGDLSGQNIGQTIQDDYIAKLKLQRSGIKTEGPISPELLIKSQLRSQNKIQPATKQKLDTVSFSDSLFEGDDNFTFAKGVSKYIGQSLIAGVKSFAKGDISSFDNVKFDKENFLAQKEQTFLGDLNVTKLNKEDKEKLKLLKGDATELLNKAIISAVPKSELKDVDLKTEKGVDKALKLGSAKFKEGDLDALKAQFNSVFEEGLSADFDADNILASLATALKSTTGLTEKAKEANKQYDIEEARKKAIKKINADIFKIKTQEAFKQGILLASLKTQKEFQLDLEKSSLRTSRARQIQIGQELRSIEQEREGRTKIAQLIKSTLSQSGEIKTLLTEDLTKGLDPDDAENYQKIVNQIAIDYAKTGKLNTKLLSDEVAKIDSVKNNVRGQENIVNLIKAQVTESGRSILLEQTKSNILKINQDILKENVRIEQSNLSIREKALGTETEIQKAKLKAANVGISRRQSELDVLFGGGEQSSALDIEKRGLDRQKESNSQRIGEIDRVASFAKEFRDIIKKEGLLGNSNIVKAVDGLVLNQGSNVGDVVNVGNQINEAVALAQQEVKEKQQEYLRNQQAVIDSFGGGVKSFNDGGSTILTAANTFKEAVSNFITGTINPVSGKAKGKVDQAEQRDRDSLESISSEISSLAQEKDNLIKAYTESVIKTRQLKADSLSDPKNVGKEFSYVKEKKKEEGLREELNDTTHLLELKKEEKEGVEKSIKVRKEQNESIERTTKVFAGLVNIVKRVKDKYGKKTETQGDLGIGSDEPSRSIDSDFLRTYDPLIAQDFLVPINPPITQDVSGVSRLNEQEALLKAAEQTAITEEGKRISIEKQSIGYAYQLGLVNSIGAAQQVQLKREYDDRIAINKINRESLDKRESQGGVLTPEQIQGFKLRAAAIKAKPPSFGDKIRSKGVTDLEASENLQNALVNGAEQFVKTMAKGLADAIASGKSLGDVLRGAATDFLNLIAEKSLDNLTGSLFNALGGLGGKAAPKAIPLASGGMISGGSGSKDDVPAMLMGGEYVMKKSSVSKYGPDFMEKLNNGSIQKFAKGGKVQKRKGGFFTPGTYGGTIEGKQNLLDFATQGYTSGKNDVIDSYSNPYGGASVVNLEPESARLTNVGRTMGTPLQQATDEAKQQAFGTYTQQLDLEAQLKEQAEAAKKAQKDAIVSGLIQLGVGLAGSALASGFAGGAENVGATADGATIDSASGITTNTYKGQALRDFNPDTGKGFIANPTALQKFGSGIKASVGGFSTGDGSGTYGGLMNIGNSKRFIDSRQEATAFQSNLIASKSGSAVPRTGGSTQTLGKAAYPKPEEYSALPTYANKRFTPKQRRLLKDKGVFNPDAITWEEGMVILGVNNSQVLSPKLATGGSIPQTSGIDTVPAMLSGGEFIMNSAASDRIGKGNLERMNSGVLDPEKGSSSDQDLIVKLDELINATKESSGEVNITVNGSTGQEEESSSGESSQKDTEFAKKLKVEVLKIIKDEKRLGGSLSGGKL